MRHLMSCQRNGTTLNHYMFVHTQPHMADSEKYEYDVHISKYNLNGCWNSGGEAGLGYILEPTTIPLGLDDTGVIVYLVHTLNG